MRHFAKNGYEITAGENEITFVNRKTWELAMLMIVLGSWVAVLAFLSVLLDSTVATTEIWSDLPGFALPEAAILLLVVIWIISRAYRTRRDQPIEEIRDILIVDLPSQMLRSRMGETVAHLADVKARMHIDWWTRGSQYANRCVELAGRIPNGLPSVRTSAIPRFARVPQGARARRAVGSASPRCACVTYITLIS